MDPLVMTLSLKVGDLVGNLHQISQFGEEKVAFHLETYSLFLNQTTFNPMLQPEWMKHKISILSNFSSTVIGGLVR